MALLILLRQFLYDIGNSCHNVESNNPHFFPKKALEKRALLFQSPRAEKSLPKAFPFPHWIPLKLRSIHIYRISP